MSRHLCKPLLSAVAFCVFSASGFADESRQDSNRETIGEVLGKPVYTDEIQAGGGVRLEDELWRLFLGPLSRNYCELHKAEIEPTPVEIDAMIADLRMRVWYGDALDDAKEAANLRLRLRDVDTQLAEQDLTDRKRERLENKRELIRRQLDELPTPAERTGQVIVNFINDLLRELEFAVSQQRLLDEQATDNLTQDERDQIDALRRFYALAGSQARMSASWMVSNWKHERHLYDNFGGGRVLWEQTGYIAIDANRKWLESEEQQGNLKIIDPKLRDLFFRYWAHPDHTFLLEDEERIRREFLEPEWAPRDSKRDS